MTEARRYWTNLKEPELVVVVALVEVEEVAAEVAAVVEALEGVDHPAWEDCSRLECRS